jgi:hypothetical protein
MAGTSKEAPVSDKTKKGMSLNIDDRKFIKMQNDYIIDMMNEKLGQNLEQIVEIVIASNNKLHAYMERIDARLTNIENILQDHERRIIILEDCLKNRRA